MMPTGYGPIGLGKPLTVTAARLGITAPTLLAHLDRGQRWCAGCERWLPAEAVTPTTRRSSVQASGKCQECAARRGREARAAAAARAGRPQDPRLIAAGRKGARVRWGTGSTEDEGQL